MVAHAPLVALLLAFFVAGFAFGLIALMPAWVRQRVEIRRLRRVVQKPAEPLPAAPRSYGSPPASLQTTEVMNTVARGARATN
jgi:hypothetical protein